MNSMSSNSRVKVLRQLARTPGEVAGSTLEREAHKILAVLNQDERFDVLRSQIEMLDAFAFRVADLAVEGVSRFLTRLETLELLREDERHWAEQYETTAKLAVASLELLGRLRYFRTRDVIATAFSAASSEIEEVRKSAAELLRQIAEFDIDVFYSGENRAGLGVAPQLVLIEYLERNVDLKEQLPSVVQLCTYLLSPNMTGTSWDYRSVTWQNSATPAVDPVKQLRSRTLALLKAMYDLELDIGHKRKVINAMLEASRLPNHEGYSSDVRDMISNDTAGILLFLEERLIAEPLPIIQKIEHDTYWRYYHAPTDAVRAAALKIRDRVEALDEYKIYRDLIGFEGIFQKWEDRAREGSDHRSIEEYRSKKALEYASSIDSDNWPLWRDRILNFCRTESDDLATFPRFYEFLEKVALHQPKIILGLLKDDPPQISRFTIPMLRGLWSGPLQKEARDLTTSWIARGEHLVAVTKLFWANECLDNEVLRLLFERLAGLNNLPGLRLLVGVAASNYAKFPHLLSMIVLPCIQILSQVGDGHWVNDIWYSDDAKRMLSEMDESSRQVVLDGLVCLEQIDFHVEQVIEPLAERDPIQVARFFRDRIAIGEAKPDDSNYDAIPFSFHQLQNTLEKTPELMVDTALSWFREPMSQFLHRGGHFLKVIFPKFPKPFSDALFNIVREGGRAEIEFVLEVLRNYEGEEFLYELCKEMLVHLDPNDQELLTEVSIVLSNTGVVHGEFGFAEAYESKAAALTPWLTDPMPNVRSFAGRLIGDLRNSAKSERRRAEEDIALRKHMYGVRDAEGKQEEDS